MNETSNQEVQEREAQTTELPWEPTTTDGQPRCQGKKNTGLQCEHKSKTEYGSFCKKHSEVESPPEPDGVPVLGIDAEHLVRGHFINKRDGRIAAKKQELAQNLWYLACPKDHTHIGILFTHDPFGREIGPSDWYSAYHQSNESWTFGADMVVCQECWIDEIQTHLRISEVPGRDKLSVGSAFRIKDSHQRFIRKMSKAEAQKMVQISKETQNV